MANKVSGIGRVCGFILAALVFSAVLSLIYSASRHVPMEFNRCLYIAMGAVGAGILGSWLEGWLHAK